jgi:hypothetical protein
LFQNLELPTSFDFVYIVYANDSDDDDDSLGVRVLYIFVWFGMSVNICEYKIEFIPLKA